MYQQQYCPSGGGSYHPIHPLPPFETVPFALDLPLSLPVPVPGGNRLPQSLLIPGQPLSVVPLPLLAVRGFRSQPSAPCVQQMLTLQSMLLQLTVGLQGQQRRPDRVQLAQLSATLNQSIAVLNGIRPSFAPGDLVVVAAAEACVTCEGFAANASKQLNFSLALAAAKQALDSVGLAFHLAGGTALGAHREGCFISFDPDIDLEVFRHDYDPLLLKEGAVPMAFSTFGFDTDFLTFGTLEKGMEWSFFHTETGVKVDVFFAYREEGKGEGGKAEDGATEDGIGGGKDAGVDGGGGG